MTSNTMFFTMTLAALLTLSLALSLNAAEDQQEPAPVSEDLGQIDSIPDNRIEPTDQSEEQTSDRPAKPTPQSGNLRARDIGDAFKNFQPSEEISADNAVTFPVDI